MLTTPYIPASLSNMTKDKLAAYLDKQLQQAHALAVDRVKQAKAKQLTNQPAKISSEIL